MWTEFLLAATHHVLVFSLFAILTVEIVYAERRHLRKPKGSAPGSVRLDREKTLLLRLEPARLARLLASER